MRVLAALFGSARDRRHQQHFIPVLKRILRPAQKADVFLVHINVEEAADLSGLVAQVGLQFRKLLIEDGE